MGVSYALVVNDENNKKISILRTTSLKNEPEFLKKFFIKYLF